MQFACGCAGNHTYQYTAFGNELNNQEPSGFNPFRNPFRFNGEYLDFETGTYYLRARHFNPRTGRFTQPDPHWGIHNMVFGDSPTLRNERFAPSIHAILQAGNLYVFTINNPIRFIDPTGLKIRLIYNVSLECGPRKVLTGVRSKTPPGGNPGGGSGSAGSNPTVPTGNTGTVGGNVGVTKPTTTNVSGIRTVEFMGMSITQDDSLFDSEVVTRDGRTNVQRMRSGDPPQGIDGNSIHIHHMNQSNSGPLVEMLRINHQAPGSGLHTNIGPSQIDRAAFRTWKKCYWQWRSQDFGPR
jgi:RHS repeat-associated protein